MDGQRIDATHTEELEMEAKFKRHMALTVLDETIGAQSTLVSFPAPLVIITTCHLLDIRHTLILNDPRWLTRRGISLR